MKQYMNISAVITVVIIILLTSVDIQAKEPLVIVTDTWPPFVLKENQNINGTDVEIIRAVFAQLKIPIKIVIYPWKRCLSMVKSQKADAILDASITQERKNFLSFPDEPVSEGITVFFIKKGRQIPFTGLQDLNGLRAGTILGYSYCESLDKASFMKSAYPVGELEQNFRKLLTSRIDFLIEVDAVGYFTTKQMGISDQITIIPNAHYCHGGNHLAFAKKPGYDKLTAEFGQALRTFKTTKNYQQILQKYGIEKP